VGGRSIIRSPVAASGSSWPWWTPAHPIRYVLGDECDEANYHSTTTTRDRVRFRQQILEDLGWIISRVWSTDWVRDPGGQVARILAAYARSREATEMSSRAPEPVEPEPPIPPPEPPTIRLARPGYLDVIEVSPSTLRELLMDSLQQFVSSEEGDLMK
jgi:REase_MTES_1575